MKKVLLLNSTFEILHFITERKALRLLFKNKVEIVSEWDDYELNTENFSIKLPSTLKMKYYVKKHYKPIPFTRRAVFRRDKFTCQYCNYVIPVGNMTIDHIIPKSFGGKGSFTNCVTCCLSCNARKGNKTLKQANMFLLKEPTIPTLYSYFTDINDCWHEKWDDFFRSN